MEFIKSLIADLGELIIHFTTVILGFLILLGLFFRKKVYIIVKTLPRDLNLLLRAFKTGVACGKHFLFGETIVSMFKKSVDRNPDKVLIKFQDTTWTVKELDLYSNKIARIFQNKGFKKGDVVALISYNKPEYVGIWLGLGKIGVVTALINTNLKSEPLAHCINIAKCKALIFTSEFAKDIKEICDLLPSTVEYIVYGKQTVFENSVLNMDELLSTVSSDPVKPDKPIKGKDKLLYIYTSGTTGLPKAAIMVHEKLVMIAAGFKYLLKLNADDIVYDPLPLYHTAGGLLGILPAMLYGLTVVIKVKFSASNYFADCVKYKCTVMQRGQLLNR